LNFRNLTVHVTKDNHVKTETYDVMKVVGEETYDIMEVVRKETYDVMKVVGGYEVVKEASLLDKTSMLKQKHTTL